MMSRLLPALAVVVLACSSSSSSGGSDGGTSQPCNVNPWDCPTGQVCWPETQTSFQCLNVGAGKLGDTCVNAVGQPTCGAGLACFQAIGSPAGTCVSYCSETEASHACPTGAQCATVALGGQGGPEFHVCVVTTLPSDGGSDGPAADATPVDTGAAPDAGTVD